MRNIHDYNKGMFSGIILTCIALSIPLYLLVGGLLKSMVFFEKVTEHYTFSTEVTEDENADNYKLIEQKLDLLNKNGIKYDYFGFRSEKECGDIAAKAVMMMLDDEYAAYYTPEEAMKFLENTVGTYTGMGITINLDISTNQCIITNVVSGSPAEKVGIQAGDTIVKVGDIRAERMNASEVADLISEEKKNSKTISMTVIRKGNMIEFNVGTDKIVEKHVEYNKIQTENHKVGYIKLDEFSGKCVEQVKDAINNMGIVEGYIIDLRGNPGGNLDYAVSLVGYFTGKNKLATYLEGNNIERKEYHTDTDSIIGNAKVVILINSASASASEMFSGALQDLIGDRVKVVGTTTFGKGIAQEVFKFLDGSAIKYTIGEYFTPGGRKVNDIGIKPDFEVVNETENGTDNQYNKALEVIDELIEGK